MLWATGAAGAAHPGDRCADVKLKAITTSVSESLRCHARLADDRNFDPTCLSRAQAKFESAVASAERFGCLGPNDGVADLSLMASGFVTQVIEAVAPPTPCGSQDAFTCGGACEAGSTCVWNGMACGCVADVFACESPSRGFYCPRNDERCEDHACVDPEPQPDCMDGMSPDGAGICNGDCPPGLECVFNGINCGCIGTVFACESPDSICSPSVTFGFCKDSGKTCALDGSECACQ